MPKERSACWSIRHQTGKPPGITVNLVYSSYSAWRRVGVKSGLMTGGMLERNLGTRLFNASQTATAKRILFGQDNRCAIETRFVVCSRGQDGRGRAGTQSQVFDGRDVAVCTSPHRLCPPSPQPEKRASERTNVRCENKVRLLTEAWRRRREEESA